MSNFDLKVDSGEIFGLLGPNGAGKTTLIKVLLGIVRPTSGSAELCGQNVLDHKARNNVGYLAENHRFPSYLTGRGVLEIYGGIGQAPVSEIAIQRIAEKVQMREWLDTPIKKYSKGMMQRIGLAQALLHDPDIVFLDEPTDGVDPVGRRDIRDFLLWLKDQGKTVFLNSHLLSEVERLCTRVAILKKGELAFNGTLEALTGSGKIFHIRSSAIPKELFDIGIQIIDKGKSESGHTNYECQLNSPSDLNPFIDRLRAESVEIVRLVPEEKSLEDFFIELVTEEDDS